MRNVEVILDQIFLFEINWEGNCCWWICYWDAGVLVYCLYITVLGIV